MAKQSSCSRAHLQVVRVCVSLAVSLSLFTAGGLAQNVGLVSTPAVARADSPSWTNAKLISDCTDVVALPLQNGSSYARTDYPDFGNCGDPTENDLIDEFTGGEADFQSGGLVKLGIIGADSGVDQTVWFPLGTALTGDPVLSGYQIPGETWAQVVVRARAVNDPFADADDEIIGGGVTDGDSIVHAVLDGAAAVSSDSTYVTTAGDSQLDVSYIDPTTGTSTYALSVPEDLGDQTPADDPLLPNDRVLDSSGDPVDSQAITVTAVPIGPWPAGEPFPQVGSGETSSTGYAAATIDTGLDGVQDDPAFETESGHITLAVNYTNSDGHQVQAFTASDTLTSYDDPALFAQVLETPSSSVLSDQSITVDAEPEFASGWPAGDAQKQVASCSTDSSGHPHCVLDLSDILGSSGYVNPSGLATFDVWYQNSSDVEVLAGRYTEDVSSAWSQNVLTQTLKDSSGDAKPGEIVSVVAQPSTATDPTNWTEAQDYPLVGQGLSDSDSNVNATVGLDSVLNDPTYNVGGSVTLDVYYADPPTGTTLPASCFESCLDILPSSGAGATWTYGYTVQVNTNGTPEDIMAKQTVEDGSGNPLPDVNVLGRLEPVTTGSWSAGEGPIVGVGDTTVSGAANMTPMLGTYVDNSEYETANEVMIVDLYYQSTSGDWTFVTRVPYYLGGGEDQTLAQTQLLDSSDDPLDGQQVIIRAIPIDTSSWDSSVVYPEVGNGHSDSSATIHAQVDLSPVEGNSDFENSDGLIEVGAYYDDSSGDEQLGATAIEQVTPTGDQIAIPTVKDGSGDPVASQDIVLKADPLPGASSDCPSTTSTEPTLATAETNASGDVNVALDLSSVLGDSCYVSPSGVMGGVGVLADDSGTLTSDSIDTEYVGAADNPVVADSTSDTNTPWSAGYSGVDFYGEQDVDTYTVGSGSGAYNLCTHRWHWLQDGCFDGTKAANQIGWAKSHGVGTYFNLWVSLDQLFCKASDDGDSAETSECASGGAWDSTNGYDHGYTESCSSCHYDGYNANSLAHLATVLNDFNSQGLHVNLVLFTWNPSGGFPVVDTDTEFDPAALTAGSGCGVGYVHPSSSSLAYGSCTKWNSYQQALSDFLTWLKGQATPTSAVASVDLMNESYGMLADCPTGGSCYLKADTGSLGPWDHPEPSWGTSAYNNCYSFAAPNPASSISQNPCAYGHSSSSSYSGSTYGCMSGSSPDTACLEANIVYPWLRQLMVTAHGVTTSLKFGVSDAYADLLNPPGGSTTLVNGKFEVYSQRWYQQLYLGQDTDSGKADMYIIHMYQDQPWTPTLDGAWASNAAALGMQWTVTEAGCHTVACTYEGPESCTDAVNASTKECTNSVDSWWLANLKNFGASAVVIEGGESALCVDHASGTCTGPLETDVGYLVQRASTLGMGVSTTSQGEPSLFQQDFDASSSLTGSAVTPLANSSCSAGAHQNQFTGAAPCSGAGLSTASSQFGTGYRFPGYASGSAGLNSPHNSLLVNVTASGGHEYLYRDYGQGYALHDLTMAVYVGANPAVGGSGTTALMATSANSTCASLASSHTGETDVTLVLVSGVQYLALRVWNAAGSSYTTFAGSGISVTTGSWYYLDLHETRSPLTPGAQLTVWHNTTSSAASQTISTSGTLDNGGAVRCIAVGDVGAVPLSGVYMDDVTSEGGYVQ